MIRIASLLLASAGILAPTAFALQVGDKAPCVGLEDRQPDGSIIEQCLRTRGKDQSFTLIEFFTTGDVAASKNREALTTLGKEIAKNTTTRFVVTDKSAKAADAYRAAHADVAGFPVASDPESQAKEAFGAGSEPTVFLLDKKERVLFRAQGTLTAADVAKIKSLVGG